jgi:hypothetical protein
MTQLNLTSGQILDIIASLRCSRQWAHKNREQYGHLAVYYDNMIKQFEDVYDKLQELPGEKREAHLILAMN